MMTSDTYLVVGIVILALAIPSLVNAFSERRAPRIASIMVLVGGGLIALAISRHPGGYAFGDVPDAIIRVIGLALR